MVCAEMRDQSTKLRSHSCRSAMLHYRSYAIRMLSTIIMSPLVVLGLKDETQQVPVELFSSYEDCQDHPVTDVYVEIQTKQIQYYSVTLHITAHFSGLRYIMFHWPLLSASIGKSSRVHTLLSVFKRNLIFLLRCWCKLVLYYNGVLAKLVSLVWFRLGGRSKAAITESRNGKP